MFGLPKSRGLLSQFKVSTPSYLPKTPKILPRKGLMAALGLRISRKWAQEKTMRGRPES